MADCSARLDPRVREGKFAALLRSPQKPHPLAWFLPALKMRGHNRYRQMDVRPQLNRHTNFHLQLAELMHFELLAWHLEHLLVRRTSLNS